jgi:phospholipid/cholesterol/gamma-HCH transport system substrate-binding protein
MEPNSRLQLKVGLYIAIGTVCIFTSIFFLGAKKALFANYTSLSVHFDQVQGLAEGSIVSLSGINVGNIQKITFLPDTNKLEVKMDIENNYISRVRKNSLVEIRTQGALGDKYLFIFAGSNDSPEVSDGDILDLAPASDIMGVISQRGGEAGKIFDVVNEFNKMAQTINNEDRLNKILKNFESASTHLVHTSQELDTMMASLNQGNKQVEFGQKLNRSMDKLENILEKIDRGEGSLGLLINDPSLHNQLKSMVGGSQRKTFLKSLLKTSIEKDE